VISLLRYSANPRQTRFGKPRITLNRMLWLLLFAVSLAATDQSASLHSQGVQLYKAQQYEKAVDALTKAAASEDVKSPDYAESALLIAHSYFMLSAAPKAIPWLEKVPPTNESNYMLGYAYLQAQRRDDAEAAFARLFELDPKSASGHMLAAQMMLKREFETEAVTELNAALAIDSRLPQAHFLRSEIEIKRGELEAAINDLNTELHLDPNFSMAWYRLGDAYIRQDKYAEAIPHLQRAVWLNPEFSGPFILLGRAYLKTGNLSNAEGILRRALVIDPNNTAALYALAQTLSAENKGDEARSVLERMKAAKAAK
jgi:tetratricopeptide (TPR) repeat protein